MYNTYKINKEENSEDKNVIESIFLKPNTVSESIKEAILEMNIMRDKRISSRTLHEFVQKYNGQGSL